ncbi:MAG: cysteine--tRNA ligase [Desulfobulbaceae bacterium]|jgi:cysteinyl-tRNA synthetase|nr:cysteine--tRNA ligase [Desulfobulbaceae bacterium]
MTLCIFNTLTGKKDPIKPMEPGHVKLYVCGITAYDYCHIGHARSVLAFDMLARYLRFSGYNVTYVRNFTDIDDKIINRATEKGVPWDELARRFIDEFHIDMDALGALRPDVEPKATEHIEEMIDLIGGLIEKGVAYPAGGDVFFAVDRFPRYGRLSGRKLDDMQAGARVSVNELKQNPMDFVLWKASKPGEPSWPSPWGTGRPGWHIECSAMSRKYLGATFDIHGGGQDLIFPHHENEIAQSEAANCCPFVHHWIHHGFVTIHDEKMSKSLNNFLTVRDILAQYDPEVLRFLVFSTHYRNPLDFSEAAMQDAAIGLERLYRCLARIDALTEPALGAPALATEKDQALLSGLDGRFGQAMDNDLNSATALAAFFEAVKCLNRLLQNDAWAASDVALMRESAQSIRKLGAVLGLLQREPAEFFRAHRQKLLVGCPLAAETIQAKIAERDQARAAKNWQASDALRDELAAQGLVLKDGADGTSWTVKKNLRAPTHAATND